MECERVHSCQTSTRAPVDTPHSQRASLSSCKYLYLRTPLRVARLSTVSTREHDASRGTGARRPPIARRTQLALRELKYVLRPLEVHYSCKRQSTAHKWRNRRCLPPSICHSPTTRGYCQLCVCDIDILTIMNATSESRERPLFSRWDWNSIVGSHFVARNRAALVSGVPTADKGLTRGMEHSNKH